MSTQNKLQDSFKMFLWLLILHSMLLGDFVHTKDNLILGYLTGSERLPDDIYYRKPGQFISGAITLAVNEINKDDTVLPNHEVKFLIGETYGQEESSIRQTMYMIERNVSAVIGPQETCIHEGRLAASFNVPMVSYFCTSPEMSNKNLYPTFARTKPPDTQISQSVLAVLLQYNWKKVVFVYNDKQPFLAKTIHEEFEQNGIDVRSSKIFEGPYFPVPDINTSPFIKIIEETFQFTRVYVMLAEFFEFEGLLIALKRKGLLDTGEYIVLGVDAKQYDPSDPEKYIAGLFDPETVSSEVAAAFQGLLLVTPAAPLYPWYKQFMNIMNDYLEAAPFNFDNNFNFSNDMNVTYKYMPRRIVAPESAYLYDAVWIYARAAHQALLNNQSPSDGRAVLEYIKETTYQSAMGYMNRIDKNGDCQGNFTLLARKKGAPNKGYGMYPVGTFQLDQNKTGRWKLGFQFTERIDWIGGKAPVDEPHCGFMGEHCIPEDNQIAEIIGGTSAVVVIVVLISIILWRKWNYEKHDKVVYGNLTTDTLNT